MPTDLFVFGPFELDAEARRLTKRGEAVVLSPRQFDLLHILVARAGQTLSKDALIDAAWAGVAVTDNSLEQAISAVRRALADPECPVSIETQARRGYRFAAAVGRRERRASAETLDALLAPHRAWIEGRAALETLEREQIARAREAFERVVALMPDQASAHVGLANAAVMQFEMTRSAPRPDVAALQLADLHAREACRLDQRYGEAWATLGFVTDRLGRHADALAASRMAVSLEPDNWRHRVRLAYVSWGEERLREAKRALALLPGFPLAHWLAATVHVARQAFGEAEHELRSGLASVAADEAGGRFNAVALNWLLGLILLSRGDEPGALEQFDLELAREHTGQLYARECCANVWYAVAAIRLRSGDASGAGQALAETRARVLRHPLASAVAATLETPGDAPAPPSPQSAEAALAGAIARVMAHDVAGAVRLLDAWLDAAPEGSALWHLAVEPTIRPLADARWTATLARVRNRAA